MLGYSRCNAHWYLVGKFGTASMARGIVLSGGGVATGGFLLLPFLAGLAASTGHMDQQLVALNDRAPLAQFLLFVLAVDRACQSHSK